MRLDERLYRISWRAWGFFHKYLCIRCMWERDNYQTTGTEKDESR
jgi:hypothetical protein